MKCEMCGVSFFDRSGDELVKQFIGFIPQDGKPDEQITICGRCHVLCDVNRNIKVLDEKLTTVQQSLEKLVELQQKNTVGSTPLATVRP